MQNLRPTDVPSMILRSSTNLNFKPMQPNEMDKTFNGSGSQQRKRSITQQPKVGFDANLKIKLAGPQIKVSEILKDDDLQ